MTIKFVKADYMGKEHENVVYNAAKEGILDSYVKNPKTGKPIKLPKELVSRIINGESIDWNYLLNYKAMNQ